MLEMPAPPPPTSEILLGIAKTMNRELEKLPLQSHGTVLHIISGLLQHRQISEKLEFDAKMQVAQADAQRKQKEAELRERFGVELPAHA